jgi:hypothetical protein
MGVGEGKRKMWREQCRIWDESIQNDGVGECSTNYSRERQYSQGMKRIQKIKK